jgi:indole-3-glycerol phosphate synthase
MKKQKSYKELENEKTRGKRRFLERLVETEEAEKQIKEYDESSTDDGDIDRQHGVGPVGGECRESKLQ